MQQLLTTFGVNWQLLLIQAVNFSILLVVLWHFLYKPISRMLEERRLKIAGGVQAAKEAHEKLAEADTERASILRHAAEESERTVAAAREVAKQKADSLVAGAHERAGEIVSDAATRAQEMATRTMKESEAGIARAAVLAAEKLLRARPGASGEGERGRARN